MKFKVGDIITWCSPCVKEWIGLKGKIIRIDSSDADTYVVEYLETPKAFLTIRQGKTHTCGNAILKKYEPPKCPDYLQQEIPNKNN